MIKRFGIPAIFASIGKSLPALIALAALCVACVSTTRAHVTLIKIGDGVVDASALTFRADPPNVNGATFQQDAVHTFADWQYVVYYDGERHACIARRHLPGGSWQVIRLLDYHFKSNDGHNVISLGICARDGTIHLAFDHHVSPLHYRVSKAGVATHPDEVTWSASLFGPVRSDLEEGKPIVITYPRFWSTPDGGLQFHYRRGNSGNGDNMLVDYQAENGKWSNTRQIDSRAGEYRDEMGSSPHRNAYPNGYDYDSAGRLQATWVWRESAVGVNHDLCYGYSDDRGNTWFNDLGQRIQGPARIDTPFLAVEHITLRQGLMNNQAQAIDSKNRIHVVMWFSSTTTSLTAKGGELLGPPADRRFHHFWREAPGIWHDDVIPWVAGSRPRMYIDTHDNLFLIYGRLHTGAALVGGYYAPSDLVIATASARNRWQDWSIVKEEKGPFINEMLADPTRWKADKIMSVLVQDKPKSPGTPSPLRIIDYRFSEEP
ncbi:BNR repeat-containing family member [Singulisphaera sp. GP187]|uniref:BNR repeat-containing protein n=1 Tax=Singulisphaera sp. GP187 TaxID=1882752 RepID=UPI0009281F81|nr:BNR repeat-containing protein [Singulisphaera sp. GP187]SIO28081.1 BNR repeat-containing family member [Singulisphaera sp. GP187]